MRIRNLRIFSVLFVIVVVLAVYGLALLRTYVFKPPAAPSKAAALASGEVSVPLHPRS
ncbi:MAG: hypothetical protein RDU20_10175 [Desulfomonilaceae bacterium]|nr:hypothetical protein [Desulfomonilaceae bacterium]